jgi:hypothetical protein
MTWLLQWSGAEWEGEIPRWQASEHPLCHIHKRGGLHSGPALDPGKWLRPELHGQPESNCAPHECSSEISPPHSKRGSFKLGRTSKGCSLRATHASPPASPLLAQKTDWLQCQGKSTTLLPKHMLLLSTATLASDPPKSPAANNSPA